MDLGVTLPDQHLGGHEHAVIDLNGQQVNLAGLVIGAGAWTDLKYQAAGTDLLSLSGLTDNSAIPISISFSALPNGQPSYEFIADSTDTLSPSEFALLAQPVPGYALSVVSGGAAPGLYLTAVPEPGTFALFGAGLMSLLGFAWRRRKAG